MVYQVCVGRGGIRENMKRTLFVAAMLSICFAAHAAVSASIKGGTSYVYLGVLSAAECKALINSPVIAGMQIAVDGHVTAADDVTCRSGAKIDLVSTHAVVKVTPTGITTWLLAKSECVGTAVGLLEKGAIRINGGNVAKADEIEPACSQSSNSITVPLQLGSQ